ncbi:formylglycine-generating enzyme family protein [Dermatophilus congolensis]|uniref:formylglycine-generating enzyme family protein n=2 Tax=Dermatophilus congolensis TaxID=1863 RepID=UPI001FB8B14A|nr:formylglycine-generating enzyme family protein [Dermatophilus congolensis]
MDKLHLNPKGTPRKSLTMKTHLVTVPLPGAVKETVIDRRTGQSWIVHVEPFALADTVVTHGVWNDVCGKVGDPQLANFPKTDVTWRDAILFCNKYLLKEGLTPVYKITECSVLKQTRWRPHSEPELDDWIVEWNHSSDGYRLPTDAEWQVACRAGTLGARYGHLNDIAWYADNSDARSHPVRSKQPNTWGLFDLLGGVWEWCWDLYDPAVYGSYRIIRGGGWNDPEWSCRAGVRRKTNPSASFDDLGFRLARGAADQAAVRTI